MGLRQVAIGVEVKSGHICNTTMPRSPDYGLPPNQAPRGYPCSSGSWQDEAVTTTPRQAMDEALSQAITTQLRPSGFRGSFPHLRRQRADRIDLISFQFHSAGGSFVVEVAKCDPAGLTTSWGKHIPPAKVTAHDVNPRERPRIGSATFPVGDHWYVFAPRSYEPGADTLHRPEHYEAVANEAVADIHRHGEPFWSDRTAGLATD